MEVIDLGAKPTQFSAVGAEAASEPTAPEQRL